MSLTNPNQKKKKSETNNKMRNANKLGEQNQGSPQWCEWQGKVQATEEESWNVRLLRRGQSVTWEATNYELQRRAMVTVDHDSLPGSEKGLNIDEIIQQLIVLCQHNLIELSVMEDEEEEEEEGKHINNATRKSSMDPDILLKLHSNEDDDSDEEAEDEDDLEHSCSSSLYSSSFTLIGQHWDYRDVALAQLEMDNQLLRMEMEERKQCERALTKPVLSLAAEQDSDLSVTTPTKSRSSSSSSSSSSLSDQTKHQKRLEIWEQRMNEDMEMKQEVLNEAYARLSRKMNKYRSMRKSVIELRSELELKRAECEGLDSRVKQLTDNLTTEMMKQVTMNWEMKKIYDKIVKDGLPEWVSLLNKNSSWFGRTKKTSLEISADGCPLYFRKLMDFELSENIWDLMQSKYLFLHRKKASADGCYAFWEDRRGNCIRGNILHYCARNPHLCGMMEWLLKDGSIDPNLPTNDDNGGIRGNSALLIAIENQNIPGIKMLLMDERVNKEQLNHRGCSAVMTAIKTGDTRILSLLCEFGCKLDRMRESVNKKKDGSGSGSIRRRNALHLCAESESCSEMLRWILESGLMDPNVRTDDEWQSTALMIAAARGNLMGATLLLNDSRVNRNAANTHGSTALMHAAGFGHDSMVALLLDHSCDPNVRNRYGQTVLDKTRERRESEVRASFGIFTSHGLTVYDQSYLE